MDTGLDFGSLASSEYFEIVLRNIAEGDVSDGSTCSYANLLLVIVPPPLHPFRPSWALLVLLVQSLPFRPCN